MLWAMSIPPMNKPAPIPCWPLFRPLRRITALASVLTAFALGTPTLSAVPHGYLDVTTVGADPSGETDSTAALQAAIIQAREESMVVWLPPGTYRISDRLEAQRVSGRGNILMGSTVDPENRATLFLAPNSPGFNHPTDQRVMLHFYNDGTAQNESNTAGQFNQGVVGVDFKVGPGNDGAVALRLQGAEGCTIQDVRIDLTEGGHTGILGFPGSGGSTHGVTVIGGRIGLDTRRPPGLASGGSQPTPVVSDATLIGQSDVALYATSRGALVLVGSRIVRHVPGSAIRLLRNWEGQPFDASLMLVDCIIEYADPAPASSVVEMVSPGRSFLFENTYVKNVGRVWPGLEANANGWTHFKRAAVHIQPDARPWGQPAEPVYVDGEIYGDLFVEATADSAPPDGFDAIHRIPGDFPTWETPGIVDVTTLGAIGDGVTDNWAVLQDAINRYEMLFFPKGTFMVSNTLELRPDSKLVGSYHTHTTIQAIATLDDRFAGTTDEDPDQPIIRTADVAGAQTWLGFLQIKRTYPLANHNATPVGNFALEWRSGGESIVRMVEVESRPSRNYRPDFAAANFWGINTIENPIDQEHPQQSFPDGMWAWPCDHPNVVIRGNGGGRWYNFWFHGRQALREHVPFLLVEGTTEPLHIYHLHMQQQDSRNHGEFRGASNISIYGTKAEIKGALTYFEDCDNVRVFGNGGLTSPNPDYFDPYLFRFVNCENFLIGGIGDTINEGESRWIGGAYDRWIHANLLTWFPVQDASDTRGDVTVPSAHRPILYQRGDPALVPFSEYVRPAPPAPWTQAVDLRSNNFRLPWFGTFHVFGNGFIYHFEHGALHTPSTSTDSLWLWQEPLGWLWTSEEVYPFLYHEPSANWLYYLPGGEPGARYFFNFDPADAGWFTP